jgi:Zn-finger nucleic acid-binding protein
MSNNSANYGPRNDPTFRHKIRCPKDGFLMEQVPVGGLSVDRCANCGAMWFDARELEKVLKHDEVIAQLDIGKQMDVTRGGVLGDRHCPRDGSPLITMVDEKQTHIEELGCTVCGGVLLDAGELRDLSEFTLKEKFRSWLARRKK